MPMIIGMNKQNITDGLIEGIVGGQKEYSTAPSVQPEASRMLAMELIKAIESKDPDKVVSAFEALMYECESEESPEMEIEL